MAKQSSENKELPNVYASNETGVLARLWGKIIRNNHLASRLGVLIDEYVKETGKLAQKSIPVNRKTKSSLIQNIYATNMSWSVFLDLLFNYLKVREVTITIKLKMMDNSETFDSVAVSNPLYSKPVNTNTEEKDEKDNVDARV